MTALDPQVVEHALLHRLIVDQERGTLQAEASYQALFPGHQQLVAKLVQEAVDNSQVPSAEAAQAGMFGSFEPIELIGRGGQGVVYRAMDTKLPRVVALKVLAGVGALDRGRQQRFRREAEIAARLDHPGLCRVLEFGIQDNVPFLAMQYVPGISLAKALTREDTGKSTIPDLTTSVSGNSSDSHVGQVLTLVVKIARALHAAHEEGIVHRDVKPANIMITPRGEPVVLDFGLARDEDAAGNSLTLSSDMMGTPAYMAPEQIAGNAQPDRRTDVFALGVVLYECLTGKRPFDAPTRQQMFDLVLRGQFEPASRRGARISRDLDQVLAVALDIAQDRRYETAAAFADDIQRVLSHEPVMARPAGWLVHLQRWTRRNRLLAACMAALLIISTSATVLITSAWLESSEARAEAEAINEFILKDMLAASNPRGLGREARIVDALKRSTSQVNTRLGHKPRLAAAVRFEIAKTYAALGLWDESLALSEQALLALRSAHGQQSPEALQVELQMASVLASADKQPDANDALSGLQPRLVHVFGEDSVEVMTCRTTRCLTQASPQQRSATLAESLAILQRCTDLFGPSAETTRLARSTRVKLLLGASLKVDALQLAKQQADLITKEHGADSYLAIESQLAYCDGLRGVGRLHDALDLLPDLVARAKAALGDNHPEYLVALHSLGQCYSSLRMLKEAVATHRLVAARATTALGREHSWTLRFRGALALTLRRLREYDEALEIADELLVIRQRDLGPESPAVAATFALKSSIYRGLRDWPNAIDTAQRALTTQERNAGPKDPTLVQYVYQLSLAKILAGDLEGATTLKRRQIDLAETAYGPRSHWHADALAQLGELLIMQEQFQAAEAPLREAISFRHSEKPTNTDRLFQARGLLAVSQYRQGKTDRVLEELETVWAELAPIKRLKFRMGKSGYFAILQEIYERQGNSAKLAELEAWLQKKKI